MHHQMSQPEKLSITELLRHENLCAKKLSAYTQQIQDPQIRSALSQYQGLCQQHVSMLNNLMQQAVGTSGRPMV
jgi:hypothetical protein